MSITSTVGRAASARASAHVGIGGAERLPDELREKAREHIADLPAETALGNADPEATHTETPAEWEAEHQGPAS